MITPLPTIRRAQRDQRTRFHLRRLFKAAPHLNEPRYRPLSMTFVRICYLLERCYSRLAVEDVVSAQTGELRSSLETLRHLASEQRSLAKDLGLSPSTAASMVTARNTLDLGALRAEFSKVDEDTKE